MNEEEIIDIKKMRFASKIESYITKLDFQHKRIFEFHSDKPNNLDADFYMILLKRLYRRIEDEQHDSRVGNLKGKFNNIHKKIQIRNDFEHKIHHKIDHKKFPHITPGIIVVGGLVINDTKPHIVSGNQQWFLNEDHKKFKKLMREFAKLYPFTPKPKKKVLLICRILKKLTNRYCKK